MLSPVRCSRPLWRSSKARIAPNPHDVPEAIAKLVSQAKGSRPARVVVGEAYGSEAINRLIEPVQAQVIEGLDLGQLAKVR